MAPASSKLTEQTLLHHWQAFGAGDVETIMSDYATDAVLITPDGTLKGSARIRSLRSSSTCAVTAANGRPLSESTIGIPSLSYFFIQSRTALGRILTLFP